MKYVFAQVENCRECPHSVDWIDLDELPPNPYCRLESKKLSSPEIPDWCPLPDDHEEPLSVAVIGNPFTGLEMIGPFAPGDEENATECASQQAGRDEPWWIVNLEPYTAE